MEIFYFASVFIIIIIIRLKFLIYPFSLDYSLNNRFVSYSEFFHANPFLFVKVEAEQISFLQRNFQFLVIVIQIFSKLLLTTLIILVSMPDL